MRACIAFVVLYVRFKTPSLGIWLQASPDAAHSVAGDVPERAGSKIKQVKTIAHLPLVADGSMTGAGDDLIRHVVCYATPTSTHGALSR